MSIIVNHVSYSYQKSGEAVKYAVTDVDLKIEQGEFVALIGHTGSGKSTLAQLMNGLLKPSTGAIYYNNEDISEKGYDHKALRQKVGLVFQYPEYQLFDETVFKDVCFGPKNFGLSKKEAEIRAYTALKDVGLSDDLFYQSPFLLSGGEKRRAAIAGVLAVEPEVLILDEPTAGLDGEGRDTILSHIKNLQKSKKMTVILITHSMDDVADCADRVIVMEKGFVVADDCPRKVFAKAKELKAIGLDIPMAAQILYTLKDLGLPVDPNALTLEESAQKIMDGLSRITNK